MKRLTWKIGGEAGFGIMVAGMTFSKVMNRAGLHIVEISEYPSLIRGGHNTVAVTVSDEPVHAPYKPVDILIALNKQTVEYHVHELFKGAIVVYDGESFSLDGIQIPAHVTVLSVPLMKLTRQAGGNMIMRNTVTLGASIALLNIPFDHLSGVLTSQFQRKGEEVVAFNINAARAGYDYVANTHKENLVSGLTVSQKEKRMVMTAADAVALGALSAGMKFFAAYPMTPINSILAYIAVVQEKIGVVYKQPEDEIAAINMAIGASFAGVRSMVATSGGGFSLMVEGASFAGMIEEPVVIIMGMRPGPATGLPTWTAQGDLHFILNAGGGEFPRLVVAPGDVEEAYYLTAEAFNLADRYQTPTFVLVDRYICETRFSSPLVDPSKIVINRGKLLTEEEQVAVADLPRYQLTDDGVSPRGIPGRPGGVFRANSDEHNEHGYSDEEAENTQKMVEKRMKKQQMANQNVPDPTVYGEKDADITLVGWGSTKGAVLEAMKEWKMENGKWKMNYLHLNYINPFPSETVSKILSKAKKVVDIEGNYNGQMADYIRMKTGIEIKDRILKYDGRPFYPEEIIEELKKFSI